MLKENYTVTGQMTIFDFLDRDSGVGRTSPEPSVQTTEKTSESSSNQWRGWSRKMPLYLSLRKDGVTPEWSILKEGRLPGEQWTLNSTESPRDAEESFLSQILEVTVPEKYFLSERACLGIIRRSLKRSKTLPEVLLTALIRQAGLSEEKYEELKKEWTA